ncbi:hypothetical protein GWK47_014138 [Chionoecetes opilio]|uniref:MADF domain-containing protein n=1 Tax=Chionoecetes opilio TaxID=41210 RepID=A0A8J4Y0D9_CHIOP|nr:hypothetical protein GWK47_014138 [Chionoecetes opilio]
MELFCCLVFTLWACMVLTQSCRKKKDPPPPSRHLPSADESASSHHEEEPDSRRSLSPTHGRARSASPTSRPSSPVGSLASDGDGPGEEEHAAKKKTTKKRKKTRKDCKISDQDVEDDLVEWFSDNDSRWNTQRTAYRDKARRQRLLATKAEQLGISSEHLWTWFKSLRGMFTRLDKKKSGDGQPTFTEREKWIREKFKIFQRAVNHRSKPVKSMKAIIAQSEGNLDEAERAAAEQHVEVDDDGRELATSSSKSSKSKWSSEPHPEIEALQKKVKESGEIVEVLRSQILPPEPVNDRTTFSAKGINKVLAIFLESSSEDELPSIAPRRQPTATVTSVSPASSLQQVQQGVSLSSSGACQWRAPLPGLASVWQSQDPAYMQQYHQQQQHWPIPSPSPRPVAMSRAFPVTSQVIRGASKVLMDENMDENTGPADASLSDQNSSGVTSFLKEFDTSQVNLNTPTLERSLSTPALPESYQDNNNKENKEKDK